MNFPDVLLAMSPQMAASIQRSLIMLVGGAAFIGVSILLLSFWYAMQRSGKVMIRMIGPDGTVQSFLVKLGVNGVENIFNYKRKTYIVDDRCKFYENFPGGGWAWMQSKVAMFMFIEGVAQPIYLAERGDKTQVLASSTLFSLINHTYQWVGTQFVEKFEQMQAQVMGNPKLQLWLTAGALIGVIILAGLGYMIYKNLDELRLLVGALRKV